MRVHHHAIDRKTSTSLKSVYQRSPYPWIQEYIEGLQNIPSTVQISVVDCKSA